MRSLPNPDSREHHKTASAAEPDGAPGEKKTLDYLSVEFPWTVFGIRIPQSDGNAKIEVLRGLAPLLAIHQWLFVLVYAMNRKFECVLGGVEEIRKEPDDVQYVIQHVRRLHRSHQAVGTAMMRLKAPHLKWENVDLRAQILWQAAATALPLSQMKQLHAKLPTELRQAWDHLMRRTSERSDYLHTNGMWNRIGRRSDEASKKLMRKVATTMGCKGPAVSDVEKVRRFLQGVMDGRGKCNPCMQGRNVISTIPEYERLRKLYTMQENQPLLDSLESLKPGDSAAHYLWSLKSEGRQWWALWINKMQSPLTDVQAAGATQLQQSDRVKIRRGEDAPLEYEVQKIVRDVYELQRVGEHGDRTMKGTLRVDTSTGDRPTLFFARSDRFGGSGERLEYRVEKQKSTIKPITSMEEYERVLQNFANQAAALKGRAVAEDNLCAEMCGGAGIELCDNMEGCAFGKAGGWGLFGTPSCLPAWQVQTHHAEDRRALRAMREQFANAEKFALASADPGALAKAAQVFSISAPDKFAEQESARAEDTVS